MAQSQSLEKEIDLQTNYCDSYHLYDLAHDHFSIL